MAATASAEQPRSAAERVRVVLHLAPDCPAPEAFERALDERLGEGWRAAPGELARTVTITALPSNSGSSVRLDYEDAAGRPISRQVTAKTCREALEAMAVITAVAIDAQVHEQPGAPASRRAPQPTRRPATPAPAPAPSPVATPRPLAPRRPRFVHEVGVRLGLAAGFGSRAAFGFGAEWGLVADGGVALRAALEARDTGTVPASDGRARFRALTARAELCPFAPQLTTSIGLPVCSGLEGGVLRAEGVISPPAVTFTRPTNAPWLALLFTPRLRLHGSRAFAELVPEVRIPLAGHIFAFANPERRAYTVPRLAFGLSLAGGVRFP